MNAMPDRSLRGFQLTRRAGRAGPALVAFKSAELTFRALCDYHQHRVIGLHHVPAHGPAIIACSHSFATYESFLLVLAVFDAFDRIMCGVVDRLILKTPGLGPFMRNLRATDGSRAELAAALAQGELVGLAPGGMREGLRLRRPKYDVDWERRTGFVRLSALTGVPILLAACPRADDIYTVYENPLTSWAYRTFKLPLPAFRGLGPTLLPRPVKLTHVISEPILPPPGGERVTDAQIAEHHAHIQGRMHALMQEALRASG